MVSVNLLFSLLWVTLFCIFMYLIFFFFLLEIGLFYDIVQCWVLISLPIPRLTVGFCFILVQLTFPTEYTIESLSRGCNVGQSVITPILQMTVISLWLCFTVYFSNLTSTFLIGLFLLVSYPVISFCQFIAHCFIILWSSSRHKLSHSLIQLPSVALKMQSLRIILSLSLILGVLIFGIPFP